MGGEERGSPTGLPAAAVRGGREAAAGSGRRRVERAILRACCGSDFGRIRPDAARLRAAVGPVELAQSR